MSAERSVPSVDEVWDAYDEMEARLTAPLSARMLALSDVRPGEASRRFRRRIAWGPVGWCSASTSRRACWSGRARGRRARMV